MLSAGSNEVLSCAAVTFHAGFLIDVSLASPSAHCSSFSFLLSVCPSHLSLPSGCEFSRRFQLRCGWFDLSGVHRQRSVVRRAACDHLQRPAEELPGQVTVVFLTFCMILVSITFYSSFICIQREM